MGAREGLVAEGRLHHERWGGLSRNLRVMQHESKGELVDFNRKLWRYYP